MLYSNFFSFLNQFDVLFLFETHTTIDNRHLFLHFFRDYDLYWDDAIRTQRDGRASDGCLFAFKKHLAQHLSDKFTLINNNVCLSIQIQNNISYFIPRYINCNKWTMDFDDFENFLSNLRPVSFCILGDFNAHTGTDQVFDEQLFDNCPRLYHTRNSKDNRIDSKGRKVIDLLNNIGGVLLNGRHTGDREGAFTYCGAGGSSVIDYAVCSFDLLNLVTEFAIPSKEFSDHMPLIVTFSIPTSELASSVCSALPNKLKWNDALRENYASKLIQCSDFDYIFGEDSIDEKVDIMLEKIRTAAPAHRITNIFTPKNPWFDAQCSLARRKMLRHLNLLRKFNLEVFRREYLRSKTLYMGLCAEKKLKYNQESINSLSFVNNSSDWWKLANSLKSTSTKTHTRLNSNDFASYFHTLLNTNTESTFISWCLPSIIDPFLDAPFELWEIMMFLQKCKNGKAPGLDRISYEFYKNAPLSFILEVLRLLNFIFLSEDIPSAFRRAIIVPLHKKGDPNLENNYRCLSLLDTLYKIFTGLILERINNWIEVNNIINEFQAGFRKNYSTVDQIFNLSCIVHINFQAKKKTFAFFVDLKCAYDKLPRNSLFFKLSMLGLSKKIICVLMLLYSNTSCQVWFENELSNSFSIDQGVKQGCVLSPVLFSLYLNDLHDSLPGGIQFGNMKVKVLMYADDLVLLSTCPHELQSMIDAFELYCDTWGLSVNLDKSKILIFREGPRVARALSWTFKNSPIEITNEYNYLGILLNYNLSFSKHLEAKLCSAKNAINATWSRLLLNVKVDVASKIKVFNAACRAILFYGAQIWGFSEYEVVEKLLRFFIKKIFFLPSNTPNYLLNLDTGLNALYISTLSMHFSFLRKVFSMPDTRLPKILAMEVIDKRIFWAARWLRLYDDAGLSFSFSFDVASLKNDHAFIVQSELERKKQEVLLLARSSSRHDLYSQLNFNIAPTLLYEVPTLHFSYFLKARGGLLALNANPFTRNSSNLCTICNLQVDETTFHFIGICPIYNNFRIQIFNKNSLSLAEVIDLLNGHNLKALFEFLVRALKYRTLILNEFS